MNVADKPAARRLEDIFHFGSTKEIAMPLELAAIGSLIGITKGLIDIAKGAGAFFDRGSSKSKLNEEFKKLYGRIDVLALQLEQCERLTRNVPAWLQLAYKIPMWQDVSAIEPLRAQDLHRDLQSLVHESIRDHFSATFFRSDFDRLPEVPLQIEIFRSKLRSFDQTISAISPGNLAALKALWPQITTQFNDTRNAAQDIQRKTEDLQAALIRELREAASGGLRELDTA